MKLSELMASGLGPYEILDDRVKVVIGDRVFNMPDDDREVELFKIDDVRYTYKIDGMVYDFESGSWSEIS